MLRATRLDFPDGPRPPPVDLSERGNIYTDAGRFHIRWADDNAHRVVTDGNHADTVFNALTLPFDDAFELRLDAARRLWRELKGRRQTPVYGALPRQSKTRHILNLRAVDGRRDGATQRFLAEALFAAPPIPSRDWRDHPLRHKVRAILHRADRLVAGGYRDLLFYPGKAPR